MKSKLIICQGQAPTLPTVNTLNCRFADLPICRNHGSAGASPSSEQKSEIAKIFVASPLVGDGSLKLQKFL